MNLHQADTVPDWQKVDPAEWNPAQRLADATDGLVTPGNAVSVAGAGLVTAGLVDIARGNMAPGIVKIGIGRVADLFDGTAADKTGTKSPVGEAADVIIDKTEMAAALPLMVKKEILPGEFAAAVMAQYTANGVLTTIAKRRENEMHTSRSGKLSTGLQWGAIGTYNIAAALKGSNPEAAQKLRRGADILAGASVVLGAFSVAGYMRDALKPIDQQG